MGLCIPPRLLRIKSSREIGRTVRENYVHEGGNESMNCIIYPTGAGHLCSLQHTVRETLLFLWLSASESTGLSSA